MLHHSACYSVASLVVISCFISAGHCQSGTACPTVLGSPGCVCDHPDGKIDLTSIANPTNSPDGPKFKGLLDDIGYSFTYNPCYSYGEGLCANVHACETNILNEILKYSIAFPGTEQIYIDTDDTPYVFYQGPGGKTTYIYLHCTSDDDVKATTEGDKLVYNKYVFHLRSKHVCPAGKIPSADKSGPIGISIMFLLVFGVFFYFAMGMVVMRVKYNATGVDLVPNLAFWKNLPILIKDGTLFLLTPCRRLAGSEEGFSEMKS